jgi:hypothetical protein
LFHGERVGGRENARKAWKSDTLEKNPGSRNVLNINIICSGMSVFVFDLILLGLPVKSCEHYWILFEQRICRVLIPSSELGR